MRHWQVRRCHCEARAGPLGDGKCAQRDPRQGPSRVRWCAVVVRFRGAAGGDTPPDFRNVGTCKLVSEMGFTCLAFVPPLLGNRLLQPVLRGAEPSPGAFAVRDHGRRVPLVACVAEVAVPTRVVVFAPVVPVLGVFRTDFVRWAGWTDMVSDRPGDRAVEL